MEEKNNKEFIDLRMVVSKLRQSKKLFLKVWVITFVAACLWIFPQPRQYETQVMLAPETNGETTGGSLSNIASSFGINLGNAINNDAIYPLLYPDVVESNDFIVSLFDFPVKTIEGDVETTYLDYLVHYQKKSIWRYPVIWITQGIQSLFPSDEIDSVRSNTPLDPFRLSRKEEIIVEQVRQNVRCSVDKKTEVITLSVSDQDPLVCATLANFARERLQEFIIEYRTSKARTDVAYYTRMVNETRETYQQALAAYGRFCDTHRDIILQTMQSQRDELENDMQMKYNTYNAMSIQLDAAKAKVQERTPAFTTLQNASVPTKPTKPKRMIFVLAMLIFASMGTTILLIRKDLHFTL